MSVFPCGTSSIPLTVLKETLFPPRTEAPGSYDKLPRKKTPHPCQSSDVADFVIDYVREPAMARCARDSPCPQIRSDLLGYISFLHLRISDEKDVGCSDCRKLAMHASHAVDFPKTGTPVNFKVLPRPPRRERPDYLAGEGMNSEGDGFYQSEKALGVLFRSVSTQDTSATVPQRNPRTGGGDAMSAALRELMPEYTGDPGEALLDEMREMLRAYRERLGEIGRAHTVSKNPNACLTEGELVSGVILGTWADHRKRTALVDAMGLQVR